MSYTRSYHEQIAVHYSGSKSYPASEHGGTVHYSGTVYENVTINIKVDTGSFDNAIDRCNNNVSLLTGAVVATEAAHVASIHDRAMQVGRTIVSGFFKTVKSELTQQMAELNANIEATLVHLNEMAKRCVAKQTQMQTDYRRLSERYTKIFTDLNNELENRIYALDQPTFELRRTADTLSAGVDMEERVTVPAVSGAEHGTLMARLGAANAKQRAIHAIGQAREFLHCQIENGKVLTHALMPGAKESRHYAPVAVFMTNYAAGADFRSTYPSALLEKVDGTALERHMNALPERGNVPADSAERIRKQFNNRISTELQSGDAHSLRVAEYMGRLFDLSQTKTV